MTLQEFVDSITDWAQGHRQKILDDFQNGLQKETRQRILCTGMRYLGENEKLGHWFHQETVWVDRDGNILERSPGPEDPIHTAFLEQ